MKPNKMMYNSSKQRGSKKPSNGPPQKKKLEDLQNKKSFTQNNHVFICTHTTHPG